MKQQNLIIIFLLLITTNLFPGINYGLKLGMTAATQTFEYPNVDIELDYEYRYGFNSGIYVEFPTFEYLSLISDFYYLQRGMYSEINGTIRADNEQGYIEKKLKDDNRLDYLGISLSSKLNKKIGIFTPYLLGGLRYEFLLNKETSDLYENVYSKYKGNIFGLLLGVGTEINTLFPLPVLVEWEYDYDITDVKISESFNIKNKSFEFKFGFKF